MSKREEADTALHADPAQFASILHHAPMMVSLKDKAGRYTFECSQLCGAGHEFMRGVIVATE